MARTHAGKLGRHWLADIDVVIFEFRLASNTRSSRSHVVKPKQRILFFIPPYPDYCFSTYDIIANFTPAFCCQHSPAVTHSTLPPTSCNDSVFAADRWPLAPVLTT